MPRKASGTSAKANAKGGANSANSAPTAADGSGSQILESTQTAAGNNRGSAPTRGVKRRRISSNVNSTMPATELYGSGTIVASNPFDDDTHLPAMPATANNHVMLASNNNNNNKMMMPPNQQLNMHPSMHHQNAPSHHQLHPHPHPHHQQQLQHHMHQPQYHPSMPHHQMQPQLPMGHSHHQPHHLRQSIQHHQQSMYSHQNNHHYQHQMQQPMHPHAQVGPPPSNHMPGGPQQPPPQQQQMSAQQIHPDHLSGPPQQQQQPPTMGVQNHGTPHMMPQQPYGAPSPHSHPNTMQHPQQQQQQQMQQQQQPQNQMIGTSTPPHMMGGPAPTHSPYNNTMQSGQIMPQPPHSAMAGPHQGPPPTGPQAPPQQQQQLLPPSHHQQQQVDPMTMQLPPPHAAGTGQHCGYCGKCQREVYRSEPHIVCKAGCKAFFHISCTTLTPLACDFLMSESQAEWACDRCAQTGNRRVPYIKYQT